jgi:aspartyl-tRNA(Asn)/glutamyl-tRNA(Gln) amidotransferase subunit A
MNLMTPARATSTDRREIWKLSATELSQAFKAGDLTPSAALEAILARNVVVDAKLNVFAKLDAAGARAAAAESDRRWRSGEPLSALDGVPVTVKDNIPVKGLPCAWGSKLYIDYVPERDELAVARLRALGAVIMGKTTCSEFGFGRGNVDTLAFGVTRNPWNPELTTGSSTGGGVAAVASGVAPIALATDGGGSIRRPAGYCGLLGMKPSAGRLARRDALPELQLDLEVVGPITRTVDDLALVLGALQGPDAYDRSSIGFPPGEREPAPIKAARILYVPQFADKMVEAPIAQSCAAAARNFAAMGHTVDEGTVPFDFARFERHKNNFGSVAVAWLARGKPWQGQIGENFTSMIEAGGKVSGMEYLDAIMAFHTLYAELADCFARYDFIVTPSSGAMPWPADKYGPAYHATFTAFVNASGIPALTIPSDRAGGMPVGFQLIGPFGADWRLVAMARAYEQRHPWAQAWPEV